jgi:hypothetical protein
VPKFAGQSVAVVDPFAMLAFVAVLSFHFHL